MKFFHKTTAAATLAALLITAPASARDLTAEDRAALDQRIDTFEASFERKDLSGVFSVIPPKIVAVMSEQFGMEPDQLRTAMAQAMEQAMASVTIVAYSMEPENADQAVTASGRPYLLIPTSTVMQVEGNKIQANSKTLAFADDGVWYLVRIDDAQQVQFLTAAYPEFKGVDFPSGSVKMLEE